MTTHVHLGFEVGTGIAVAVPVQHLAVTGQTQLSGKTTTLEALVHRSGLSAIAFVTKRAESSFNGKHCTIQPYFRERADWQFVSAVLEATLRERLKFERSWIMRACKGADTLAKVQRNVRRLMDKSKGMSADVYMTLDHYLDIVIPQIDRLPYTDTLDLRLGVNVMDLSLYTTELQSLVIRSVIEFVYEKANDVLVIIPEAWEFIPQNRGSPVLLACEQLIRKGGAARNFVWLDSQDIAGVHKSILRQVGVWTLGVQREANEVKRALAHIPGGIRKPTVSDIMGLERGQFFACFGRTVTKVYVQPAWMDAATARAVALGEVPPLPPQQEITAVDENEARALRAENEDLRRQIAELTAKLAEMAEVRDMFRDKPQTPPPVGKTRSEPPAAPAPSLHRTPMPDYEIDLILSRLCTRAAKDPGILALLQSVPELVVTVERRTIDADDSTIFGKVAVLITEGFFDNGRTGSAAYDELKRRGATTAKPGVYNACDKLTGYGFLTKESDGYRAVPGMKIRINEREVAA